VCVFKVILNSKIKYLFIYKLQIQIAKKTKILLFHATISTTKSCGQKTVNCDGLLSRFLGKNKIIQDTPVLPRAARKYTTVVDHRPAYIYLKTGTISVGKQFTYISEIYEFVDLKFSTRGRKYKDEAFNAPIPKYTLYHGNKPLPRRKIALREYNIKNKDTIKIELSLLIGGSSLSKLIRKDYILGPGRYLFDERKLRNKLHNKYIYTSNFEFFFIDRMFTNDYSEDFHIEELRLNIVDNFSGFTLQNGMYTKILYNYFLNGKEEYIKKLIEDVMILLNGLKRCYDNNYDKSFIVEYSIIFIKLRTNKSIISLIEKSNLIEYITKTLNKSTKFTMETFEDNIGKIRNNVQNISKLKKSKFAKSLYKIGMFAMSISLFDSLGLTLDKLGYTQFEQQVIKHKYKIDNDMMLNLLDGLLFLVEKGYQTIKTGSIDCIFHSSRTYSELYDTVMDLKQKQHALCNPQAFGFTEEWYLKTLDDTIAQLKSVSKYAEDINDIELRQIKSFINDLTLIRINKVIKSVAQETRMCPFAILFYAKPGVGKTSLTKIAYQHFGKTHSLPTEDCYMYTRNPVANFADGFNTRHWCWLQDDIAFKKFEATQGGDVTTNELIQLCNGVPFTPDQASIEDKGKIPARPKLVIGTTNVKDLNAFYYFSCPSALQRRLPFIVTVEVKPEYQKNDGSEMLDSSKTSYKSGEYPDYWILTVSKVVVPKELRALAKFVPVMKTDNIYEFCRWLSIESHKHLEEQKQMLNSLKDLNEIEVCKNCFYISTKCTCQLQSGSNTWLETFILFIFTLYVTIIKVILKHIISQFGNYIYYTIKQKIINLHSEKFEILLNKQIFSDLGDKIKNKISYPNLFKLIALTLGSSVSLYKIYQYLRPKEDDTTLNSDEFKPKQLELERENPWIISDFKLNNIDLTPSIISSKQFVKEEINNVISKNVSFARIYDDVGKKYYTNNILCLKGNIYIANAHWFNATKICRYKIEIIHNDIGDGVNNTNVIYLNKDDILFDNLKDLAFFILPGLVPKKDITKLIAKETLQTISSASLIIRRNKGELNILDVKQVKIIKNNMALGGYEFESLITMGLSNNLTIGGDCGSPLILHTPKGHILASIHRAGNSVRNIMGIFLSQEYILSKLEKIDNKYHLSNGKPLLREDHTKLNSLHNKSVFNYLTEGKACVYGSLTGFKSSHKSRVCKTIMNNFLSKHGYEEKVTKPNMKGWQPWRLAAQDLIEPVNNYDSNILKACKKAYLNKILRNIKVKVLQDYVEPYDLFTSINGANGVAYVDKINRNTSAGYPFYKSKRHFLNNIDPERDLLEPVEITQEIKDRIKIMEDEYLSGNTANPVFVASLKDEPLSFEKAEMGKVRVFGSAPMDWTILCRKYFLSLLRLMKNNKIIFETAISTVAQSAEWGRLYAYITKFGKNKMIAGDFRKFDKKMPPEFIREAFDILIELAIVSNNYTDEQITIMRGIAADTAYPLMDFNNDLVKFFGSMPSGMFATVDINSIVNSLYLRYTFVDLYKEYIEDIDDFDKIFKLFDNNIHVLTYGDDNVINVSNNCNWYNHTNIAKSFKKMDIDYTMADKNAESVPFIHISNVSFLKRTWRYDLDLNSYVAPLDHDSIEKMLMVWVSSDTISPESQCVAVISSAIREYFFYGREIFEEKHNLFKQLLIELNLSMCINETVLPSYDDLIKQFKDNSMRLQVPMDSYNEDFNLQNGETSDNFNQFLYIYIYIISYFYSYYSFINSFLDNQPPIFAMLFFISNILIRNIAHPFFFYYFMFKIVLRHRA
jgi:hypothetical protein